MELTRYTLDNGMKVLMQPTKNAPVVACNVWVGVGSADEEPSEAGLAHVHEHMLFKGTARRGVGVIAREIESCGGHINAFTSFDQTCYYVVMSSRFFDAGLDILSDAIRNSSFDGEELGRELEVIQEEIKRSEDSPGRMATLKLFQTAYQEHPYRLPVIGSSESVDSFKREDVLAFFNKHYVPANMALVLVGDFEIEEAKAKVEQYFADFKAVDYEPVVRKSEPEQTRFRARAQGADIKQTHLRVGFHVPHATHDDIPILDMLGAIMGYGDASYLFQTIQRERELVNSIYSAAYTPKEAGLYMISADYQMEADDERSHDEVVRAIMEAVFRFREMRVSAPDIQRARTIIESQEIYGKQTIEGLAMKLGHHQMVTGDPLFEEIYYKRLSSVTAQDIQDVARKYLTPQNCTLVMSYPEDGQSMTAEQLEIEVQGAYDHIAAEAIKVSPKPNGHGLARIKIPDGPTLIIQEDHSVETFAIRALNAGGVRFESPETNGINKLLSTLITEGTQRRSGPDISREVESMAASLSGISGRNSFGLAMNGLTKFFEPCFDVFADCLFNSTVPDEDFERERKLQIQDIRSRQDQLGAVNYDQFTSAFFRLHPYAMPSIGSIESLGSLAVEQARQYLARVVQPQDLVLVVVGDVETDLVVQLVERYFVHPARGASWELQVPEPAARTSPALVVGDLEKNQAHIMVGFDAPPLNSSQIYALEVLYAILSGQGGRLFYELRDRQSLAYSVYASMILGLDVSAFTINIGTSPEKIEQAVAGIVEEVSKLRKEDITVEELERAKRYLIGNHDIGLQKNSSRAMTFGLDELYDLGYKRTLKYSDYIASVALEDVQEAVAQFLNLDTMVVSIVKPKATEVTPDLLEKVSLDYS